MHLYCSLSKTGKGHGTDVAVTLGLQGYDYRSIDTKKIPAIIDEVKALGQIRINRRLVAFHPGADIIFENSTLLYHPNACTFEITDSDGETIKETYYSVGGGL